MRKYTYTYVKALTHTLYILVSRTYNALLKRKTVQIFECLAALTDKIINYILMTSYAVEVLNSDLTYPDASYVYVLLKRTFLQICIIV